MTTQHQNTRALSRAGSQAGRASCPPDTASPAPFVEIRSQEEVDEMEALGWPCGMETTASPCIKEGGCTCWAGKSDRTYGGPFVVAIAAAVVVVAAAAFAFGG